MIPKLEILKTKTKTKILNKVTANKKVDTVVANNIKILKKQMISRKWMKYQKVIGD